MDSDEITGLNRLKMAIYRSETVFPDEDPRTKISEVLEGFRKRASKTTCTFVYATGHGLSDHFCLTPKKLLPYSQLLDILGTIPGKKVLVILACYSGSIINILEGRSDKDDFSIITSTNAKQTGASWNEDIIHQKIVHNLENTQKLSTIATQIKNLTFDTLTEEGEEQKPQSALNFDVIL